MRIHHLLLLVILLASFTRDDDRKAKYSQKIRQYLDKQGELQDYYSIDDKGICIYASPEDHLENKPEYFLQWNEIAQFKALMREASAQDAIRIMSEKKTNAFSPELLSQYSKPYTTGITPEPLKPLKGLRVAIDPGHVAGDMDMAKIEKKFLDMKPDSTGKLNEHVQIMEGQLTLNTALLLKSSLEQAGAIVMLTRSRPNESAFGKTFDEWMKKDYDHAVDSLVKEGRMTPREKSALAKASKRDIFRKVFFELELQERARKINAFKPDITVIIHYNVDDDNTNWKQPSDENYNMAFVGGSFMKGELNTPLARLEFLRLIVCDDIEGSVQLSALAVKQFGEQLDVPLAATKDAKYLSDYCMETTAEGVYARNLTLTRLVHGTLVYGETLCQDNMKECIALNHKDGTWNGITTSMRVKQVADAYFNAVKQFAEKQH